MDLTLTGLALSAFGRHVSNRPTVNANTFYAPGYTTLDLGVKQEIPISGKTVVVRVDVANVFDKHYLTSILPGGLIGYSGAGNAQASWVVRALAGAGALTRVCGIMRLGFALATLPVLACTLAASAPPAAAPPQRIADLWYAHNAMVVMLGAVDKVAVTVATPKAQPWMFRMAPALAKARVVANGPANAEALMAARVDLAFVAQGSEADRLSHSGISMPSAGHIAVEAVRGRFLSCRHLIACQPSIGPVEGRSRSLPAPV